MSKAKRIHASLNKHFGFVLLWIEKNSGKIKSAQGGE